MFKYDNTHRCSPPGKRLPPFQPCFNRGSPRPAAFTKQSLRLIGTLSLLLSLFSGSPHGAHTRIRRRLASIRERGRARRGNRSVLLLSGKRRILSGGRQG
ncbi:unnamed protein product [Ectocarpus sp. 8 AP-2014]